MSAAAHALLAELNAEVPATRRVLERLPADKFDWRPHPKSLSVAELAQHVATIPANVARLAAMDGLDLPAALQYRAAEDRESLLATFDASIAALREALSGLDEARANATWRLKAGDREIFAVPRAGMIRTMGL